MPHPESLTELAEAINDWAASEGLSHPESFTQCVIDYATELLWWREAYKEAGGTAADGS